MVKRLLADIVDYELESCWSIGIVLRAEDVHVLIDMNLKVMDSSKPKPKTNIKKQIFYTEKQADSWYDRSYMDIIHSLVFDFKKKFLRLRSGIRTIETLRN